MGCTKCLESALPTHAWRCFPRSKFERDITTSLQTAQLLELKKGRVDAAIENYLTEDARHAVATVPSMLTCIWPMTTRMVRERLFPAECAHVDQSVVATCFMAQRSRTAG